MKTIYLIIGTRPDAIKMAPIYHTLKSKPGLQIKLVSTGQHKELLSSALKSFNLKPDINLKVMRHSQSLSHLTRSILKKMELLLKKERPDLVLTHGDTATCYAASLACFYEHIPVYHIEAGLRSHNLMSPYPEEFFRKSVSTIASYHFIPSIREKENLLNEGIDESKITITGNTIHEAIDTFSNQNFHYSDNKNHKSIIVTIHRREKNNTQLLSILNAVKNLALKEKNWIFTYLLHPNSLFKQVSSEAFNNIENVILTYPLDYKKFISLLHSSDLILTDSGGIQEEAAYIGKHAFILRDTTERYDGIANETTKIIGTNTQQIEEKVINYFKNDIPRNNKSINRILMPKTPSEIIADYILGNPI